VPISVSASLKAIGLTAFESLIERANLTEELDNYTGVTVFAPSNAVLATYSNSSYSSPSTLQNLVKGHVVEGSVLFLPLLTNGLVLDTLAGTQLKVTVTNGSVFINDAEITLSNVVTENGVIQVINKVSAKSISVVTQILTTNPIGSNTSSCAFKRWIRIER
jgi:uncharacterized surface protein with fasciclin (FAS1) repeats